MEPEIPQGLKRLEKPSALQRFLEFVFRLLFGNWLEKWEMDRKIARLSREQSSSFESYFSADVCKGHIDKHGENVVTALAVRLQEVAALADDLREVATTKTI
jgi:ATP-dependent exoDNAse (exonuclease V) alpha subunit